MRLEHQLGFVAGARIQMYARDSTIVFYTIFGNINKNEGNFWNKICGFNCSFEVQSTLDLGPLECLYRNFNSMLS
jgi:hypothetical protein